MIKDKKDQLTAIAPFVVIFEMAIGSKLGVYRRFGKLFAEETGIFKILAVAWQGLFMAFIAYLTGWAVFRTIFKKEDFEVPKDYSKTLNWACLFFAKIALAVYAFLLLIVIIF